MGQSYTKIQLSLKWRVHEHIPIFVGYTQLMMWNLFIASPYFYDLNYNPNIFYRLYEKTPENWIDFGLFEHESNGKGGSQERSWNRVFLRYHVLISQEDSNHFFLSLKAWIPFGFNDNNRDLAHFRGLFESEFTWDGILPSYFERCDLSLRFYLGGSIYLNPLAGAQELTWRFRIKNGPALPLFTFQVFHGFAETLISYPEENFAIRGGIGF